MSKPSAAVLARRAQGLKLCGMCGTVKPFADFNRCAGTPDNCQGRCRECSSEATARYRAANPERVQAGRDSALAWNRAHPREAAEHHWRSRYGISADQYEELLRSQHGGCAICGGGSTDGRRLHVDHDHTTGEVRALLCRPCNLGLAGFRDRPDLLEEAIAYLVTHRTAWALLVDEPAKEGSV